MNNEKWLAFNLSLADTPQISFTQSSDFNFSLRICHCHYIPASSLEVLTITTNLKFEVWKYFNKIIVDGVKRAQCKLCTDISYAFLKNAGTGELSGHIKSKHPKYQAWQTQISTLGSTLDTFTYNHATCKTNLAKYLIRSEHSFSKAEDEPFKEYIRTIQIWIMSWSVRILHGQKYLKNRNKY